MSIDSVCHYELMEHQGSCNCCLKCPNFSDFKLLFALCHYYCNYFLYYIHYSKTKSLVFGWNSLQITGQLHHPSRENVVCSIQQQHRLNLGPPRCLLPQQGRHRPWRPLGRYDGCMKAIRHAWQGETDRPSYQQIGQSTSSCPATRDQQVQDPYEPANKA